jgi:hypothetical protein
LKKFVALACGVVTSKTAVSAMMVFITKSPFSGICGDIPVKPRSILGIPNIRVCLRRPGSRRACHHGTHRIFR